jgi:hypothetical protein
VKYSQQLREYSIAFLLAALILLFFVRFMKKPNLRNWISFTLVSVLAVFLQYGLALLIVALNAAFLVELIFRENRRTTLGKWLGSQTFVLLAVLVVYFISLREQMQPGGFGASSYLAGAYWDGSIRSLARFAFTNTSQIFEFINPTRFLFRFVCVVGFLSLFMRSKGRIPLLMFVFPMAITFVLSMAKLYPYHGDRQDIFLTPMIVVLAGFGFDYISKLDRKYIATSVLIVVLGLSGLRLSWSYLRARGPEHIEPITRILASSYEHGDRIYVYYAAAPAFMFYYRENVDRWIYCGESAWTGGFSRYMPDLDELLSVDGRVWLVFSHCIGGECESIREHASRLRTVDLIAKDEGAWLYLAR